MREVNFSPDLSFFTRFAVACCCLLLWQLHKKRELDIAHIGDKPNYNESNPNAHRSATAVQCKNKKARNPYRQCGQITKPKANTIPCLGRRKMCKKFKPAENDTWHMDITFPFDFSRHLCPINHHHASIYECSSVWTGKDWCGCEMSASAARLCNKRRYWIGFWVIARVVTIRVGRRQLDWRLNGAQRCVATIAIWLTPRTQSLCSLRKICMRCHLICYFDLFDSKWAWVATTDGLFLCCYCGSHVMNFAACYGRQTMAMPAANPLFNAKQYWI